MKDLLSIIDLYDDDTPSMANGGRMGFKDNPLKNFNRNPTGQNQFSGKLLTENMDLVNAIKEDAKTMSQIEVQKKYEGQLGKKTLKKIKDKYGIEFRKSYKPTGTQKKSIPYEDRFTAAEKSAMYKKRKDNVNYANERTAEYAADRGPQYDPSDYIDDMADDFASGGIARMLGE